MKFLILFVIFINTLFAHEVFCKGDIKGKTLYDLYYAPHSSYIVSGGYFVGDIFDDGYIIADMDTANYETVYYADSSPLCGGEGDDNIRVESFCNYHISSCWDVKPGMASVNLAKYENGFFINNVIIIDEFPCMPYGVSNFSFGLYDYENGNVNLGFVNENLSRIVNEYHETPTPAEAKRQRSICKSQKDLIPYVDDWENLLYSQIMTLFNLNKKTTINSYNFDITNLNLDNSYEDINNDDYDIDNTLSIFSNDYKSSLQNSFSNYLNIFGIGDYGSAPIPIKFDLLGKTYSLFDLKTFEKEIPFIRLTLLSFSYIWGSIIILKMPA